MDCRGQGSKGGHADVASATTTPCYGTSTVAVVQFRSLWAYPSNQLKLLPSSQRPISVVEGNARSGWR